MKNWLGQNIEVGSIVYRGARAGNNSSFKIGRVQKLELNKPPRVDWIAEEGRSWERDPETGKYVLTRNRWHRVTSSGSPALDSLVLLDMSTVSDELKELL